MRRTLMCCAALALFGLPCRADQTTSNAETLIRLSVQPMAAPKPALRYLLLPELREMNPGNPIQNYLKCFMEQQKFFFDKEAFERREKLLAMPLKELPAHELQEYGGFALDQADWAARLDSPDWQVLLKLKTDGVSLLIPDVQQLRTLGKALKVRLRAEVALGRFDQAIRTAKTMFALARHLGEHPTFIASIVGVSIASQTIEPLEEMLQQPRCPNLYWALTSLPTPLISLEKGREGERLWIQTELRDLDDSAPMSAVQIQRFIAHVDKVIGARPNQPGLGAWLDGRAKDEGIVAAARRRLIESGIPEERLLRYPAEQVILLDEKRELAVREDDAMKIINLPAWQVEELVARDRSSKPRALFADALVSIPVNLSRARGRLDQQIGLLRHVEALRLYAAQHNGTLPAKLSEISVPLPDDPFTGKPFYYEQIGSTGHLRGTPPRASKKFPPSTSTLSWPYRSNHGVAESVRQGAVVGTEKKNERLLTTVRTLFYSCRRCRRFGCKRNTSIRRE